MTDAKIEPARPILPESSSDRVPSRETLVTTAMSALFLALGESKTLVRGLEAWQHDLDRSALNIACGAYYVPVSLGAAPAVDW